MAIGERLRSLRGKKSLSEMGEELGVTATQLSRIENDKSAPSLDLTTKICDLYGVTMDWLIRGVEIEKVSISQEPTPAESQKLIKLLEKLTAVQEELLKYQAKERKQAEQQVARLKNG